MFFMAHYARVNSDNIVVYVTPVSNEMITDEDGVEHEDWAFDHLYSTIPDSIGDRWVQTSYNNNFRRTYAGIGYTWDENQNAFIPPKPFESWIFDEQMVTWIPPTPLPETIEDGEMYVWDEEIGNWRLTY